MADNLVKASGDGHHGVIIKYYMDMTIEEEYCDE
jgi:hypothetical protein